MNVDCLANAAVSPINLSFIPAMTSSVNRVEVSSMSRKKSIIIGQLIIAVLLLAGAGLAQDNETTTMSAMDAAQTLGLTSFSNAAENANLMEILDNKDVLALPSGSFAIFAPDDEAFAAILPAEMDALMENASELKRTLYHHIVWNDGSFENISELSSVRTIEGEDLAIDNVAGLKVNGANVTASLKYGSGTIYVIDKILFPDPDTQNGVVEAARNLGAGKFADAIQSSGLADTLNGQGLMGIEGLTSGPYTIFAPSDGAFASAKSSLDAISKNDPGLRNLLSYHVADAKGLANMTESSSIKTMLGESLAVDVNQGLVGGANVIASGRYDNGIVYVIDQVLVPIRLSA